MSKNFWAEVKNDYTDDCNEDGIRKVTCIDAWKTGDDNEEGKVIAKVILTEGYEIIVVYIDNCARTDDVAQENIREAVDRFKEEVSGIEKFGIFFEGNKYVYHKLDKMDIKNPSLISIALDEESAKFITDAYNDDKERNG